MAVLVFEAASTKTTTSSAQFIATIVPAALSSTVGMPEVREIGIFSQSGVAAVVGIGTAGSAGTTPGGSVTVQNSAGGSGSTTLYTTYSVAPTTPGVFTRRCDLQAVQGSGVIFTWQPGEWQLWAGATGPAMIYQISTSAVTYDVYVKVAE